MVAILVENLYHFSTSQDRESIGFNSKRSRMLLRDMTFVYPVSRGSVASAHQTLIIFPR